MRQRRGDVTNFSGCSGSAQARTREPIRCKAVDDATLMPSDAPLLWGI